ncbi:RNA 2',3'-cyclic phosphodiesterase [Methanobrevibacter sp. DSM 116169]|uniref:RNA 2',3'-cyclic phosphodiesterase n=1 Tax=Methanobrevibacter sp. DSM 116169 TaxID=3242727 RepID=UPI0038FCEB59
MTSKIRSFLAIELDNTLKEDIIKVQNEFKKFDSNIKFVNPNNFHLTLKFFGDIDLNCADKISSLIQNTLNSYNSFDLELKSTGAFPNNNHIKVLWIGFKNNDILTNLQKDLDNEFFKLGFKKERDYKSHLTIARVKGSKNRDLIKKTLENNKNITIGKMKVSKIHLKKSTLTPNGPIYEDLKVFDVTK